MLIIDMPMPRSCVMCEVADQGFCEIKNESVMDLRGAYFDKRPDWCPIKGELVRCGECKYWEFVEEVDGVRYGDCTKKDALISRHMMPWADYYCADGERKDGEHE